MERIRATTIVAMRRAGQAAIAGDGQVTLGEHIIMKQRANKIRRFYNGSILAGFAGSTADAFTLFEKFEHYIEQYAGNVMRAAVELAKEWRTDRTLRRLEALLIVVSADHVLIISGTGDVIEPDDGIAAIGSGGAFALAAARALVSETDLDAKTICERSLQIAAEICVYTNDHIHVEALNE